MEHTAQCPSCRRGTFAADAFCSWCGTRLQERAAATGEERRELATRTIPTADRRACGSCNGPILPGDTYCPTCGARVAVESDSASAEAWSAIPLAVCEASRGKYEFVRELGRGGMGIVFVARDCELERLVAIKVLSPTWLTDPTMVERFRREARTIASLRHESIVTVYAEGRAGDLSYFVMDYIEGVALSKVLRTHGPLPIPMVEAILYRVGTALNYAHRPGRGIVHRDIKPSNIMLDTEGLTVVMDFGISKVSERPSGLTGTGLVIGTPEYMSPEQCRGHTVTAESDQYSLGAVVYAMLTGAPPFTGPFYRVLMAHQNEPVPDIASARPDCPPDLVAAAERMLAKLPSDRWPSIGHAIRGLGLRPLPHDDPVLLELGELVRTTARLTEAATTTAREATPRTPTSIQILPPLHELEVGDSVSLTANVLFEDGVEEAGHEITWDSNAPDIARVDGSSGALVALRPGAAVITAVASGVEASVAVEISPPKVVSVSIEPQDVELPVGGRAQLAAHFRDKRGQPITGLVSWSSSDPRTATVSETGEVTARRTGSVTVLAHGEGIGTSTTVTVIPAATPVGAETGAPIPAVAHVQISRPPDEIRVSEVFGLEATPIDEAGRSLDRPVLWMVETPAVLESVGDGRFRAVGRGEGVVVAESDGARTRVRVTVQGTASSVPAVTKRAPRDLPREEEPAGQTGQLQATAVSFVRSRPVWIGAAVVVGAVALWLMRGLFVGPGSPTVSDIVVRTADGAIGADGLQLIVGDTISVLAVPTAADGSALELGAAWASDDPAVARVDTSGLVIALAGGATRISVTSQGVRRDVPVSIRPAGAEIVVRTSRDGRAVAGTVELEVGESVDLDATVADAAGDPIQGESVQWRSASPQVAAVDAQGGVFAAAAGSTTITAAAGDLARAITVRVTAVPAPPPLPRADGFLTVRVQPWAYVWIDDVQQGDGRQSNLTLPLPPGAHTVRLWIQGRTQFDTTFVVQSGGSYIIEKGGTFR